MKVKVIRKNATETYADTDSFMKVYHSEKGLMGMAAGYFSQPPAGLYGPYVSYHGEFYFFISWELVD